MISYFLFRCHKRSSNLIILDHSSVFDRECSQSSSSLNNKINLILDLVVCNSAVLIVDSFSRL